MARLFSVDDLPRADPAPSLPRKARKLRAPALIGLPYPRPIDEVEEETNRGRVRSFGEAFRRIRVRALAEEINAGNAVSRYGRFPGLKLRTPAARFGLEEPERGINVRGAREAERERDAATLARRMRAGEFGNVAAGLDDEGLLTVARKRLQAESGSLPGAVRRLGGLSTNPRATTLETLIPTALPLGPGGTGTGIVANLVGRGTLRRLPYLAGVAGAEAVGRGASELAEEVGAPPAVQMAAGAVGQAVGFGRGAGLASKGPVSALAKKAKQASSPMTVQRAEELGMLSPRPSTWKDAPEGVDTSIPVHNIPVRAVNRTTFEPQFLPDGTEAWVVRTKNSSDYGVTPEGRRGTRDQAVAKANEMNRRDYEYERQRIDGLRRQLATAESLESTPAPKKAAMRTTRGSKSLPTAQGISDFDPARDRVVRRGGKTYVERGEQYAPVEVQSDALTPAYRENIAKLTPEQRARMIEEIKNTPYLSAEGKAERLALFNDFEVSARPAQRLRSSGMSVDERTQDLLDKMTDQQLEKIANSRARASEQARATLQQRKPPSVSAGTPEVAPPGRSASAAGVPPAEAPAPPSGSPPAGNNLDAVRIKFLTAAREEENLRRVGTVQREIRQGRRTQAAGIGDVATRGGLSLEEAGQAARKAAYQGGTLRKTFLRPIALSAEEQATTVEELNRLVTEGEIDEFEYLRMVLPRESKTPGVIAKLQTETPKLEPNEVELLRKIFGDEFAEMAARRSAQSAEPKMTRAQDLAEQERMRNWSESQIEKQRQRAEQELQRANRLAAKAQESQDAQALKNAETARIKAQREFDAADRAERLAAERAEEQALAKAARSAEQAEQAAVRAARQLQERVDARELKAMSDEAAKMARVASTEVGEAEARVLERQRRAGVAAEMRSRMETIRAQEKADAAAERAYWEAVDRAERERIVFDRLEMARTRRALAAEEERFRKTASAEAQAEVDQARKLREEMDAQSPNADQVLQKARGMVGDIMAGMNIASVGARADNALGTIDYWLKGNRATLDSIKDVEGFGRVVASARAVATGELADSFLTSLTYRNHALGEAFVASGMDPKVARKVADTMTDFEMKRRYPQGVPERLSKEIESMKAAPYQESLAGANLFVQRFKNTIFSIDAGIFGVQVRAAVRRGGVNMLAGMVNRTLGALSLPNVSTYTADVALSKKVRNILDGVHVGSGMSAVNPKEGTLLSYLGPVGKQIDEIVSKRLVDPVNRIQFDNVLGWAGDMSYEGNLVMLRLLGRDIANPSVRMQAADAANAIKSFARTALRSKRAGIERALLTSPSMTRANIANILQMSKLLQPGASAEQRILAATLIASQATYMLVVGKFINDQVGVTDFIMNPGAPGFGQITLPWKDDKGRNRVIDMVPQASVEKAIGRSVRALAEGDDAEAADAWLRYISGRSSVVGAGALGLAGVGYESTGRFTRSLSASERLKKLAPVPPWLQSPLAEGGDAVQTALEFAGVSAWPESDFRALNRELKAKTGEDWTKLWPDVAEDLVKQNPDLQDEYARWRKSQEGTSVEITQRKYAGLEEIRPLASEDPEEWRSRAGDIVAAAAIEYEQAKRDGKIPDYGQAAKGTPRRVIDDYYSAIAPARNPKTRAVDYDEQERLEEEYLGKLETETRANLERYLGFSRDPVYREYKQDRQKIREYFQSRDEDWRKIAKGTRLEQYRSLDEFRQAKKQEYRAMGMSNASAQAMAEKAVSPYAEAGTKTALIYLANHPELIPLLDKWGYYVPATLRKFAIPR